LRISEEEIRKWLFIIYLDYRSLQELEYLDLSGLFQDF